MIPLLSPKKVERWLSIPYGTPTFATRLIHNGVSLAKVSKLLGNASITTTEIYAYLAPNEASEEAIRVLNRLQQWQVFLLIILEVNMILQCIKTRNGSSVAFIIDKGNGVRCIQNISGAVLG